MPTIQTARTEAFVVMQYRNGIPDAVVSGCGRHRGTWDSNHSRRTAYRHAAKLTAERWRANQGLTYRVEPAT